MSEQKPKPPNIFKMAKTFAGELAKYIKEGAPNVSNKVYKERLEECNKCPHLIEDSFRCGLCGCLLEHKAKWKTTTCPDNPPRWKPVFKDKHTLQLEQNLKDHEEAEARKRVVMQKKANVEQQKKINEALGRGNYRLTELNKGDLEKYKAQIKIEREQNEQKNNNTKDSK